MRRLTTLLVACGLLATLFAAPVAAGGPPGLAFYVDGVRYRTIDTATDLSNTGAPADSVDRIYALGGTLANVAEAKPGDRDYNGGRWMVLPVTWHTSPVQLTRAIGAPLLPASVETRQRRWPPAGKSGAG